jgi:hypothetical protein
MPFKPGHSGNPNGRPPGSRNKATIAAEKLFRDESGEMLRIALELAERRNGAAARALFTRYLPSRRQSVGRTR